MLLINRYHKLAFQVLNKEDAGLAFSKRTKQPLWVPEFNLFLAEFGETQYSPFVPVGGGRKLQARSGCEGSIT